MTEPVTPRTAAECPNCHEWYLHGNVSCTVLHQGGCCHFGDTHVSPPQAATPASNAPEPHWKGDPPHDIDEWCDQCAVPYTEAHPDRLLDEDGTPLVAPASDAGIRHGDDEEPQVRARMAAAPASDAPRESAWPSPDDEAAVEALTQELHREVCKFGFASHACRFREHHRKNARAILAALADAVKP